MSRHWFDHHPPCPGGCNNLADECACPRPNPLGSMRMVGAIGSDERDELIEFIRSDDGTDSGRRIS